MFLFAAETWKNNRQWLDQSSSSSEWEILPGYRFVQQHAHGHGNVLKGEVSLITPVASSPWEGKGVINMPSKSLSTFVFALLLEENICLTDFQVGNGCAITATQCGCGGLQGGLGTLHFPWCLYLLSSMRKNSQNKCRLKTISNHLFWLILEDAWKSVIRGGDLKPELCLISAGESWIQASGLVLWRSK